MVSGGMVKKEKKKTAAEHTAHTTGRYEVS